MPRSTGYAKRQHRPRTERLTRPENRRRKCRMIWRIGKVLGLEHDRAAVRIRDSALSMNRPIEKVAGVELQSRLRSRDVERTSRCRIDDADGMHEARGALPVEHPVVIVTATEPQLRVFRADARADRRRRAEVEWRSRDWR